MQLTSPAFPNEGIIPVIYTCEGKNWNPPLVIEDVPQLALSLVLIMDDPDVPASILPSQMWDHWIVFNIPPSTRHIAENFLPPGLQGQNTSGKNEYQGPCPPDREHRYFFKLYALTKELTLSEGATKAQVEEAMKDSIITQATLMGRYNKKQNS
jgi:Raf kinase inhibitor-like YbhB/YbcL family protein